MADELNFQIPKQGFDSYLYGIIPDDQAVLAGAFSVSMQQIRNIEKVDAQEFAKAAYNMESTVSLPLTNGTDIPTNVPLLNEAFRKEAIGSGVYGTYTMSNFFGAMSGLPYPWLNIYNYIKQLETTKLRNIYQELYLAVQWEPATVSVEYDTYTGPGPAFNTYYHVTGVTVTQDGGGYGRGGAAAPTITISGGSGATATCTIGTDASNVGSNGGGTFGRVTSVTLTSSGTDTTTIPTITIQCPPTASLPVQSNGNKATGGTNTAQGTTGWQSPMNSVVQGYINQANDEIQAIKTSSSKNFEASNTLNALWDITGIALKHEQRARYVGLPPVSVPWDRRYSDFPMALNIFVDSIPEFAKQTQPHMAVQTLEHISNVDVTGGQSIVAMMRQERNQDRLQDVGIQLDNNLLDKLPPGLERKLMVNGVLPGAVEGIPSRNGNIYTIPAWPDNTKPIRYISVDDVGNINDTPITIDTVREITELTPGGINPILDGDPNPIVNPEVPVGIGPIYPDPNINIFVIDDPLPPQINTNFTGTTLLPSTYDVNDAIDKVIECNCDCWIN